MVVMTLEGNEAAAWGARLARPDVIAAYPITPSTHIPERLSEWIADGIMDSEMILTESEHSALSACVGASAAGARVFTATASQGLALMHEILHIASGMRLPIVMAIGNRALSAPINIWCDHQDMMSQRDTGWMQFFAESNQEALDLILIAYKAAENRRVLLPAMVGLDAFTLTHTFEQVDVPGQEEVDQYLPKYRPVHAFLDPERPITQGPLGTPQHYMEFKSAQYEAMNRAKGVIVEAMEEFGRAFGREYAPLVPFSPGGEIVLVTMGSMSGTARVFVKSARQEGESVSHVKIVAFRPFYHSKLAELLAGAKVVAVVERAFSYGSVGPLAQDVAYAMNMYGIGAKLANFIVGLGGRDVTLRDFSEVLETSKRILKGEEEPGVFWLNVAKEEVLKAEEVIWNA